MDEVFMNVHIQLIARHMPAWHRCENVYTRGYCFTPDGSLLKGQSLANFIHENFQHFFMQNLWFTLSGQWSVIVNLKLECVVVSDVTRTYPLFYHSAKKVLTDSYTHATMPENLWVNDEVAAQMFVALGYTLGYKTLNKDVWQVPAASVAIISADDIKFSRYFTFPGKNKTPDNLAKSLLAQHLHRIGAEMRIILAQRQAVVPLSGGFDSRLIALLLALQGHTQVVAFTYGRKTNAEIEVSEKVAKTLGFKWYYVNYEDFSTHEILHSAEFQNYLEYMSQGTSMPYLQEYFAVKYLHEKQLIEPDAVFIPGHSGDFIGGSHFYLEHETDYARLNFSDYIIQNHKLSSYNCKNFKIFLKNFKSETRELEKWQQLFMWDMLERQAKFVVPSARVFGYFGYEYILPLWDTKLVELCMSFSYSQLYAKRIYDEVLRDEFFIPHQLLFQNETQSKTSVLKRKAKRMKWKKFVPDFILSGRKFSTDWMHYHEFTRPMLRELRQRYCTLGKYFLTYNAIISYWFVKTKSAKK